MNLFYKPSLSELAALIEQSSIDSKNYNVIVDYDGEVLIDSDASLPRAAKEKFKFYFDGMNERVQYGERTDKYLKFLNQLFKNLVFCWEKDLNGQVDYHLISKIQNRIFNKEMRELREKAYPVRMSFSV
jgi:hypothetical protein